MTENGQTNKRFSRLALLSIVLGIFSFLIFGAEHGPSGSLSMISSLGAIAAGIAATSFVRKTKDTLYGEGAASIGILLGGIALFLGIFCA